MLPYPVQDIEATEIVGQHHIEKDQVGARPAAERWRDLGTFSGATRETPDLLQNALHDIGRSGIVLYHEYRGLARRLLRSARGAARDAGKESPLVEFGRADDAHFIEALAFVDGNRRLGNSRSGIEMAGKVEVQGFVRP